MNTYNENLRSAITNSLSSQELNQKKLESQKNAALFTLYYAQGAEITASEKLAAISKQTAIQAKVKKQVVDSSNLINNQLSTAVQANQYTLQAVTNAAACASNVQIAANSIIRLANAIGSIFNMLAAADQDSELYKSAEHIRNLINDTAYDAETASKLAMEASSYTSEITSTTLLEQSKNTNALMNNLLKACLADFDATLQEAPRVTSELDSATINRSLAEGNLQDISVELDAAQSTYRLMNEQLNLGLNLSNTSATSFTVRFAPIATPFENQGTPFPVVQDYYIIVVKDSRKSTFSMITAAAILEEGEASNRIVKITDVAPQGIHSQTIKFRKQVLKDSDGDQIDYGQPYTFFLLATYNRAYKTTLNDFNDYLSAPSNTFLLTMAWPKALITSKPVPATPKKNEDQTGPAYALRFHAQTNPTCDGLPEYRCILLPATAGFSKPSFVFDLAIAQQVPAGNYVVAKHSETRDGVDYYNASVGSETTDNFGNPLTDHTEYYVFILTTSSSSMVENTARFSDVLSDLSVHSKFQYQMKDPS